MRKNYQILTTAALLLLLTACAIPAEPTGEAHSQAPQPIVLEELRVEVQREGHTAAELMTALKHLPDRLQEALAEQEVLVEEVTVTVGASAEASARAALDGGVDLAVLPAADFAALEQPPHLLLASGGGQALLCAGKTEYGANLAARKNWTWEELQRARWAVTQAQLPALDLWLADNCRGNTSGDLPHVTVCETEEALLAAEADLLILTAEREEYPVLTVTERLYDRVIVAAETEALTQPRFAEALAAALAEMDSPLFGGDAYEAVENEALHPMRRLVTIGGI